MTEAEHLDLTIERPAAGGRMVARHGGQVVFVAGAVPGERVRARVERRTRQLVWATAVEILESSADRRPVTSDPACGGMAYAHVQYGRQLALKAEILSDAFRRIGHIVLPASPTVRPSPERGYRLRARLHVVGRRAVFFREGTHEPCDAAATGQLTEAATTALERASRTLEARLSDCLAIVLAENVAGTERVLHIEGRDGARFDDLAGRVELPEGVHGLTVGTHGRPATLAGTAVVTDTAEALFGGSSPLGAPVTWTRHAASFFQGNRFLTGDLVGHVLAAAEGERAVDLYAGVGLFSVTLAAHGTNVVAVEGDRLSGADLAMNARPWGERMHVVRAAVEDAVRTPLDPPPDVVVLDPPRTGVSGAALGGVLAWRPARIIYVSCDPATLARDAARIIAARYAIRAIDAFDLFPNTAHVEAVAVFDRQ